MVVHMMPIFAASLGICLLFSGHTSAEVIGRIDTHHHFIPDFYKAYLRDHDSSMLPSRLAIKYSELKLCCCTDFL